MCRGLHSPASPESFHFKPDSDVKLCNRQDLQRRNRSGARTNGHRHQFVPNSEDEAEDTEDTSDENYDESDEEEDEMKDECSSISTDDEDESTDEDSSEIEMNYRPKRRSARQASRSTRDPDAAPSRFSTRASRRQVVSYNEDILVDQQRPVCNALSMSS